MPTIVTRGVASARGAGTFSAAPPPPPPTPTPPPPGPPPVFQTVTFNSSGVWTAPAGVSTILNLQVAGGLYSFSEGYFTYESGYNIYGASYTGSFDLVGSPSDFYTFAQAGAYADSILAQFNSGGTGDRIISYDALQLYWNSSTGGFWVIFNSNTYRINGVAERTLGPWDNRTNSPVGGPTQPPVQWGIGVQIYNEGGAFPGSPSSAFGRTAAGTTSEAQPQNITSASSVSVTPGQQYNIEVGSVSGYVTFQFSQS